MKLVVKGDKRKERLTEHRRAFDLEHFCQAGIAREDFAVEGNYCGAFSHALDQSVESCRNIHK